MNKQIKFPNKAVLIILYINTWISSAFAQSGAAMLRIDCNGNNLSTEVYVDEVFRGECPVDIQVQEGVRRLRFYKKIDQRFERIQEQEMRVGAATVKRLEILLPDAQLTAEARREDEVKRLALEERQRREKELADERMRQEQARLEAQRLLKLQNEQEKQRQDRIAIEHDLRSAEQGDKHAIFAMARRYDYGIGVARDSLLAIEWYMKAAKHGHVLAELFSVKSHFGHENENDLLLFVETFSNFYKSQSQVDINIEGRENSINHIESNSFFKPYTVLSESVREPHKYAAGALLTYNVTHRTILGFIDYEIFSEKIFWIIGDGVDNLARTPMGFKVSKSFGKVVGVENIEDTVLCVYHAGFKNLWTPSLKSNYDEISNRPKLGPIKCLDMTTETQVQVAFKTYYFVDGKYLTPTGIWK